MKCGFEEPILNLSQEEYIPLSFSSEEQYNRIQIVLSTKKYTICCGGDKNLTKIKRKLK